VASAGRLYVDRMQALWGAIDPVPASAIEVLRGGERIAAAGRTWEVEYTPGHASHHVSYFDRTSGIAFVGDAAGVKISPRGLVMPPTPPPDIDLEAWRDTLARIDAWRPDTLFLTHFGPYAPYDAHLADLREHMELTAGLVKTSLSREGDDESREVWFAEQMMRELRRRLNEEEARAYEVAGRFDLNWRGLARYWRKKSPCR
jgi:glyoxylase-like metal-dependent hydrolase (beta-lactamase superfamily II)